MEKGQPMSRMTNGGREKKTQGCCQTSEALSDASEQSRLAKERILTKTPNCPPSFDPLSQVLAIFSSTTQKRQYGYWDCIQNKFLELLSFPSSPEHIQNPEGTFRCVNLA